jgi:hypothetical protein
MKVQWKGLEIKDLLIEGIEKCSRDPFPHFTSNILMGLAQMDVSWKGSEFEFCQTLENMIERTRKGFNTQV